MITLVFVGLFVAASAAPHYYDQHPYFDQQHHDPHFGHHRHLSPYIQNDLFNTENFWDGISRELRGIDNMLAEFYTKFPTMIAGAGIEGNEYKITIPLSGFDEKDIVVKARGGMLMVQAVHKTEGGIASNYLDVRTLPECVNVKGSWTYENGVLRIVFPLKTSSESPVESTTEVFSTQGYEEQSREELEPNREVNNVNADVGLERGDQETDRDLLTNEVPRNTVEATTYAVDLKDEVEFVPVRY